MIALVFEAHGAPCLFALVVFLVWASAAKLRPDLDEDELDLAELEKLKKPVRSELSHEAISIEPPITEEPSQSPPLPALVNQSKRPIPTRSMPASLLSRRPPVQGKVMKAGLRMPHRRKVAELNASIRPRSF